ncbi:MAG: hypothetical protein ACXVBF_13680, partial [Flavisolibacter sp.]
PFQRDKDNKKELYHLSQPSSEQVASFERPSNKNKLKTTRTFPTISHLRYLQSKKEQCGLSLPSRDTGGRRVSPT